ncbi:MAG: hypothetical protein ACI4R8_00240 [Candidatus Caccovivens sp.]
MKKFSILSLSIFCIGVLVCISCAYLISTVLLSTSLFANSNSLSGEQQTIYAISMSSSKQKEDLSLQKNELQMQNGAGYIYKKDEKFYLLASVYANKSDAEKVKNNLKSSGVDCEILSIKLNSQKIEGNFSAEEKTVLSNCLKANFVAYESLYDIAISLDTKVFDLTKAKLECNAVFSNHVSTKTNLETLFSKDLNKSAFENLDNCLKSTENHLSNLICENFENSNQTFSSLIKLTYCNILFS